MKQLKPIVLTSLMLFTFSACSNNDSEMKKQFVHGCVNGGSAKSVCQCTFDSIQADYSEEQLFNMMTNMEHFDTLSAAIQKAQRQCLL